MAAEGVVRADWFRKLRQPPVQALVAAGFLVIFVLFGGVMRASGGEVSLLWGYQAAATASMLYGVGNALMSLSARNVGKYWSTSFLTYIVLTALGILAAWAYSGLWITEAGSYRWIYMVLTFGYLVLLSIVSMMRGIVHFAEREEWSQPRQRD